MEDLRERISALEDRVEDLEREARTQLDSIHKMELSMVSLQASVAGIKETLDKIDQRLAPLVDAYKRALGAAEGAGLMWKIITVVSSAGGGAFLYSILKGVGQ